MNRTIGLLMVAITALLLPSAGMSQEAIRWEPNLESAQCLAAQTNRLVLVYFSGPSCAYCRRMEAEVLSQPGVAAAINADYVPVKVIADHFPTTAKRYNITHLPTTVITLPQGQWLDTKEGFVRADEYMARLGQVALDIKRRRQAAAVAAQIPNGVAAPAVNLPAVNQAQPAAAQPMANPAIANQPVANQPTANQPFAGRQLPAGQSPNGPAVVLNVPPGPAVPAGVSPPYGGVPNPIGPPPAMNQPSPQPMVPQQPTFVPPRNQQQVAVAPPQNNIARPTVAGNPPVGLDGWCPVSLAEKQKWVPGDRRWGMNHRGHLYFFAGPEEQRRFFLDPDRYAPVVSGNDIVLVSEGQVVAGRREYGVYFRNHVYLFSSDATRAKFEANPAPYADQALQALRAGAYHPAGQLR
jgi:YHS domain-containing protein